jgi:dTDP-4-dehydrorhamnose 3,5-epimerase
VILHATTIAGAWVVEPEPQHDSRGFFARTFERDTFAAYGLEANWVQCSVSFNARRGTVRGLHFQRPPHEETKLVRCTRGALHDVLVDLRSGSPSFLQHVALELSADNRLTLYVPAGVAHGFQTTTDETEVFYQINAVYAAHAADGVRFDDPAFGITLPLPVSHISERDRSFPDFDPDRCLTAPRL